MEYDVDLIVIGGGSGGLRAAARAAEKGVRVMLVEQDRLGGTCVIRGCVPKKLFVQASRYRDAFIDSEGFGWHKIKPTFDWESLIQNTAAEITRLEGFYTQRLESLGVEIVHSRGVVVGPHEVALVNQETRVRAETILIAAGGYPMIPDDVMGQELALTSDHIFTHPSFPQKIVISGGGYIAVEFAGIFAGFGSEVTLVHRGASLLRGFDCEIADALETHYRARGISIIPDRTVTHIEKTGKSGLHVTLSGGEVHKADCMLFATGRRALTDHLGLDEVGVVRHSDKTISVNEYFQSTVPSIYAVGDCANRKNLTPVALREAEMFVERCFGKKHPHSLDYDGVATAVYSTPELATVGLTEEDARAKDSNVRVYKISFRPMSNSLSSRRSQMIMKLIAAGESHETPGRILGAHILGEGAGDMIQLIAIGMTSGMTKSDFDNTVAVHPTASEEWVTLKEADGPYSKKIA
jgi:glutathione reductase (NADPH)